MPDTPTLTDTGRATAAPILFSGPMIRALIDGKKTQTRRIIKTRDGEDFCDLNGLGNAVFTTDCITYREVKNPYGSEGDFLWVRETFTPYDHHEEGLKYLYRADPLFCDMGPGDFAFAWKPSIFMPRKASRITLRITSVRVERLQSISELDCESEIGAAPHSLGNGTYEAFAALWDTINPAHPWASSPWVWVIGFEVVEVRR